MSYMKPLAEFEPGATTKKLLLYVNKKNKNIAGTHWPGLFEDTHWGVMVIFAMLALGLEWLGLMFIIDAIGLGTEAGLMAVAALILLDVVLAFALHWVKAGPICQMENRIRALPLLAKTAADIEALTVDYRGRISRAKIYGFVLTLMIWGIAAVKAFLFFSLVVVGGGELDSQVIFIFATYAIVALIHVSCTGYALFGGFARIAWWLSEGEYVKSGRTVNRAERRYEDIVTRAGLIPETLEGEPLRRYEHTLEKLVGVDLVYRDSEAKARALLGPSVTNRLRATLRKDIEQEYLENKKVAKMELPDHAQEIDDEVRAKIKAMVKVRIDPHNAVGILASELKHFLETAYGVAEERIKEVEKGQTLYRFATLGILLDDDLSALATQPADGNGKNEIALYGLLLQLRML